MNLPNALTISRLLAIPVLMVLLLARFPYHDQIAAALFLIGALTDTLDGNLARSRGQVTELGKFLDPLADKLFILSVLIVLVQEGALAAWVVVVIFSRELLITVLRSLSASQGRVIAATPFGKTKTVLQSAAVLLLILQRPYPELGLPADVVLGAAVVFTVVSGVDYLWRFRHVLAFVEGPPPPPVLTAGGGAPGAESAVGPLVRRLHERLEGSGLTLVVAESCTGGMLAAAITDQPGSSAYFKGGVVAYDNEVKQALLDVPAEVLECHGAVSAETAEAMAGGARRRLRADLAVAVTGIAGPGADGTDKPVGLIHLWVVDPTGGQGRRLLLSGDRWSNRRDAVDEAIGLLLERLGAMPA
jgi:CDP-diacylglycerol--glycerol-3-phosphate 3-phosphatidyltransferase